MTADAGADIVVEEVFEGIRDYRQVVEGAGDPLDRLARSYLLGKKPAAFTRGATRKRLDLVLDLIDQFDVDGVLWYQLLCCEMYDEESYLFEKVLRERGMPDARGRVRLQQPRCRPGEDEVGSVRRDHARWTGRCLSFWNSAGSTSERGSFSCPA